MNKRINLIYLVCFLVFVGSVVVKRHMVIQERNEDIVSSFSQWKEIGKPVEVCTMKKKDVPSYTKVTSWQTSPDTFEGHVSRSLKDQLKIGQEILFKVDDSEVKGKIFAISEEISFETGMFPVHVKTFQAFDPSDWIIAYAHTDTIKDAINVPNNIIEKNDDKLMIWKVVDGHAVEQEITVQQKNGYGAIVSKGIEPGDAVVVKGFTQLQQGDKVNIIKENKND